MDLCILSAFHETLLRIWGARGVPNTLFGAEKGLCWAKRIVFVGVPFILHVIAVVGLENEAAGVGHRAVVRVVEVCLAHLLVRPVSADNVSALIHVTVLVGVSAIVAAVVRALHLDTLAGVERDGAVENPEGILAGAGPAADALVDERLGAVKGQLPRLEAHESAVRVQEGCDELDGGLVLRKQGALVRRGERHGPIARGAARLAGNKAIVGAAVGGCRVDVRGYRMQAILVLGDVHEVDAAKDGRGRDDAGKHDAELLVGRVLGDAHLVLEADLEVVAPLKVVDVRLDDDPLGVPLRANRDAVAVAVLGRLVAVHVREEVEVDVAGLARHKLVGAAPDEHAVVDHLEMLNVLKGAAGRQAGCVRRKRKGVVVVCVLGVAHVPEADEPHVLAVVELRGANRETCVGDVCDLVAGRLWHKVLAVSRGLNQALNTIAHSRNRAKQRKRAQGANEESRNTRRHFKRSNKKKPIEGEQELVGWGGGGAHVQLK